MALKENPLEHSNTPATTAKEATAAAPIAGRMLAVLRIATGLVFAWAFVDKTFGLGYATPSANAWLSGGSPTKGFLGNLDHGPLASMFQSWAGAWWADWLFMLGLAGIGIALLALGRKNSGEPLHSEDMALLSAVAVALLLVAGGLGLTANRRVP